MCQCWSCAAGAEGSRRRSRLGSAFVRRGRVMPRHQCSTRPQVDLAPANALKHACDDTQLVGRGASGGAQSPHEAVLLAHALSRRLLTLVSPTHTGAGLCWPPRGWQPGTLPGGACAGCCQRGAGAQAIVRAQRQIGAGLHGAQRVQVLVSAAARGGGGCKSQRQGAQTLHCTMWGSAQLGVAYAWRDSLVAEAPRGDACVAERKAVRPARRHARRFLAYQAKCARGRL